MFSFSAPAKLNLFLHLVGRRSDGYHELQTAFQFLTTSDKLHFQLRHDACINLHTMLDVPIEKNLVWRAADCLRRHTQTRLGVDIHLDKQIPAGAGLGGGSSDAATTLLVLDRLWQTRVPPDTLASLGKQLGADVPVFVRGHASWGEGIGDCLTPMPWAEDWYVVLVPACAITTAEIFSHPGLTCDTPRIKIANFLANPQQTGNDFEALVRRLYPAVAQALDWLDQFGALGKARLTGSGSAVFARFSQWEVAQWVYRQRPAAWQGFVTKGMNRSPLFFELDKMSHP